MKAVSLLSGGLDSSLAIEIISNLGIEVVAVNFVTPFCLCDGKRGCRKKSALISERLNIDLKIFNIAEEYLEVVKKPRYGYGKNLNPCIDCRILMLRKAKEIMNEIGASFIITGEVLGQRPMSQNRKAMEIIEKASGLEGLIVRPLCAKLLPASIPEKEGWINRDNLLNIAGRSRKKQFELVKKFNISDHACPAGGCLLTDPGFSLRIKDLLKSDMLNTHNVNLAKNGRYFRISDFFKLIIGRNQDENQRLIKLACSGDLTIEPDVKGPSAVGRGEINDKNVQTALKLVAYYCKDSSHNVKLNFSVFPENKERAAIVNKLSRREVIRYMI
ncbi:MAG: hypothetical protein ABIH68_04960 [bacterium]